MFYPAIAQIRPTTTTMEAVQVRLATAYAGAYDSYPPPPTHSSNTARRSSTTSTSTSPPTSPQETARRSSVPNAGTPANANLYPVRTRSVGGFLSAGVVFERDADAPISDDDIIIVTVRVSKKERRNSFDDPLPDRPPARGFLRRMSTRVLAQPSQEKYKAVKMPRGEYVRYFRHDAQGNYVGTEPEREWGEKEIGERYARYQEMPLRAVMGRAGYTPGVPMFGW